MEAPPVHLDLARVGVEADPGTVRGSGGRLPTRDDGQADVDAVPVEDPGEAPPEDAAHAPGLHRQGHVLARGADAEVLPDDDHGVAGFELLPQPGVEALEEIRLHLLGIVDVQVRTRIHDVGVDVVPGDDHGPSLDHPGTASSTSAGCTISPATAAAAATYAFAR